MLIDWEVASSRVPICSAMDMNRLLKISSSTGSARVVVPASGGACVRRSTRWPPVVTDASQPASTTVVALVSATMAGPATVVPGRSAARSWSGASRQAPSA